jgi:glyoxylase-like metal-dependent hydrolase (beta-lactamase superfamily II)
MGRNPVAKTAEDATMRELARGVYAYIQRHGELGVSNAGLVVDREGSMAIDALMVPSMTRRFLSAIKKVTSTPVARLINTHHHVDHTGGNYLFAGAEIVSHARCRDEIIRTGLNVKVLRQLMPRFASEYPRLKLSAPAVTFEDALVFHQAGRRVEVRHLGPAHTYGDALVYLQEDRLLFSGDLAFFYVTPLAFQGHVGNWIKVADRILEMDVETIIPGHGPIGGKQQLAEMRSYLVLLRREAKKRFRAGMSPQEASRDIRLGIYSAWREPERILPNVMRLYQEFRNELDVSLDPRLVFEEMRTLSQDFSRQTPPASGMCCL